MSIFALCTVIGRFYCGETAFRYLFKIKNTLIFAFVFSLAASMGVLFKAGAIWSVSDISNGLMAFPNLIALILLIKNVRRE